MIPTLPEATSQRLGRNPLTSMLGQVRFSPPRHLDEDAITAFHEAVVGEYPRRLREQQVEFAITPTGVQTSPTMVWRLANIKKTWALVLGPGQITLESTDYTVWADFAERFATALKALGALGSITVQERLGLRYVNEIRSWKPNPASWTQLIAPAIVGPAGSLEVSGSIVHALSELRLRDQVGMINLRYGLPEVPSGQEPYFLLDIDCFTDEATEFDVDRTMTRLAEYNDAAFRLFRWCITDEYWDQMSGNAK